MRSIRWTAVVFCLGVALNSMALVPQTSPAKTSLVLEQNKSRPLLERVSPDEPSAVGDQLRTFVQEHGSGWTFDVDPRDGRARMIAGSGIPFLPGPGNELTAPAYRGNDSFGGEPTVAALEPMARDFVMSEYALIGPPVGELVLDPNASQSRLGGKLISFYFDWVVDGVPVEGARVFVRVNSGNITQFGSQRIAPIGIATTPEMTADQAILKLMRYTGDGESAELRDEPRLVIQPEEDRMDGTAFRLVWIVTYTLPGEIETWEGRIDAASGDVVAFRDTNHYIDVRGGVYPRTIFEQNETSVALPLVDVVAGGSAITADKAGTYSYTGGGASSGLNGLYFNTSCQGCSGPAQPQVSTSTGNGRLDFGFGGQDQFGNGFSTPADRNSFFHLNQIRRVALKWLPSLSWLGTQNFTVNVNINNSCNAVYNGASVNFYRKGGDCNNTGEISDVMHHEWGHGIDQNTNGGDGGTGEGTADVAAMHMSHGSQVGPGFRVTGAPVRNLNSNQTSLGVMTKTRIDAGDCNTLPGGGLSVHCVGQVYGQAAWELSQLLAAKYGHHTGWRESERLYYTSLPDADTYAPGAGSIYSAYMFADDDDGNLNNGTPNATEIFNAFNAHEIAETQYPGIPHCTRPAQPVLSVTPDCDGFQLDWTPVPGVDRYEIFRTEVREDTAFMPVADAGTATTFVDNEAAPGMDYWYVVMAVDGAECESIIESPVFARLPDRSSLALQTAVSDDTPRGNRSGFADPGEEVDLVLSLANLGEAGATGISGTIVPSTPGVTIVDGTSAWIDLAVGENGNSQDVVRFQTDDQVVACGDTISFTFVPSESTGCDTSPSFFDVQIGEDQGLLGFVCDSTPACFVEPTFAGAANAGTGASCGEVTLDWSPATSNCTNAEITYNVYRSTDPAFVPDPGNLVQSGLVTTLVNDPLLAPGQIYHYIVRAFDSRSGEESNVVVKSAVAPATPDVGAPIFGGLQTASSGTGCSETTLSWPIGLESCSGPVAYDVFRSTDPLFVPDSNNLIGSTFATSMVDVATNPGEDYTYLVRSRDALGNQDANEIRITTTATALDLTIEKDEFEPDNGGWAVSAPDTATAGNWEWGDPVATSWQSGDDATPNGVNCWVTGVGSTPSNGDVDGGTTTLLSATYDMSRATTGVVKYSRWFTNDRGASPGDPTDLFLAQISDDNGQTWSILETVGAGTDLAWVPVSFAIDPAMLTNSVRLRFLATDDGSGSLVEAGVDDFELIDQGQGCSICPPSPSTVGTILLGQSGDDVLLDWTDDPVQGSRFIVYRITDPLVGEDGGIRIGSTTDRTFTHEAAGLSGEAFSYRVTAVDACGNESLKE